jgi:NDP-sugar pyrophosphorylase family protein
VQVVVLAGGIATRMRPLSERLPKSLFPVAGRPFLDWQLEALARGGASRVVLCVGHKERQIREHLAATRLPVEVSCSSEGHLPAGTGGALRAALRAGLLADQFVVTYGDSYLPVDLRPLLRQHAASGLPATMAIHQNHNQWDASNVVAGDGLVLRYEKIEPQELRPKEMVWIDFGISAWQQSEVHGWREAEPFDLQLPLVRLARDRQLGAFAYRERFFEIGSPHGLAELERFLGARQETAP